MGPDRLLHLSADSTIGTLPLLETRGVLYSSSFHFNPGSIWKDRAKLFPKVQADGIAAYNKSSGRRARRRQAQHPAGVGRGLSSAGRGQPAEVRLLEDTPTGDPRFRVGHGNARS